MLQPFCGVGVCEVVVGWEKQTQVLVSCGRLGTSTVHYASAVGNQAIMLHDICASRLISDNAGIHVHVHM